MEKDFTSCRPTLIEQREKNEELPEDVSKGYFDYKKEYRERD